jgi:hypothetical protein
MIPTQAEIDNLIQKAGSMSYQDLDAAMKRGEFDLMRLYPNAGEFLDSQYDWKLIRILTSKQLEAERLGLIPTPAD